MFNIFLSFIILQILYTLNFFGFNEEILLFFSLSFMFFLGYTQFSSVLGSYFHQQNVELYESFQSSFLREIHLRSQLIDGLRSSFSYAQVVRLSREWLYARAALFASAFAAYNAYIVSASLSLLLSESCRSVLARAALLDHLESSFFLFQLEKTLRSGSTIFDALSLSGASYNSMNFSLLPSPVDQIFRQSQGQRKVLFWIFGFRYF